MFLSPERVPRGGVAPVEVGQQELPVAPGPHARPDDAVVRNVALRPVAIGSASVKQGSLNVWMHCTYIYWLPGRRRAGGGQGPPAPGIPAALDVQVVSGRPRLDGRRADGGLDGGGAGEVDEGVGLGVGQGGGVGGVLLPELLPRNNNLENTIGKSQCFV